MVIKLPELKVICNRLSMLIKMFHSVECGKQQKWFDLKAACELKGVKYNTVRGNWYYKPKGGDCDDIMHGVPVWESESILEWLSITDRNRAKYLKKYGHVVSKDLLLKWNCLEIVSAQSAKRA